MASGSKQFTIFTKFAVKNGFTGPVLNMANGADKFAIRAQRATQIAGKLGNGIMAAGKFAAIGAGAALAAGAGMFKLAEGSAKAADDILNTSASLGISTKALQEYRYAGIAAGLSTEEMDAALTKLTVNLGKDSAAVETALADIGLTADQLKAAGPEKTLEMLASGFQNVSDPTKKAAVATALFGKSSVRMVNALSGGPDAIAKLRAEANEIGYVMGGDALENAGKFDDTLDRFGATAQGLGNRLAAKVMPQMTKLVDTFSKGIQPGGKFGKIIDSIGNFLGKGGDFLGPVFDKLGDFLPKLFEFAGQIVEALKPVIDPILGMLEPIFQIFENLMPLIKAVVSVISEILGPILESVKYILKGVAWITASPAQQSIMTATEQANQKASEGRYGYSTGPTPVSSNTGLISSQTTNNNSTVKIDVNAPSGTRVSGSKNAPPITLNTQTQGSGGWR